MRLRILFSCIGLLLTAGLVTENVLASPIPAPPKAFAVFMASYNTHNDIVRGGVCGTVFFVSGTRAVTAFHVLKPASFTPLPGFERVRIWLVHEGYPAVEIRPQYLRSNPDKDVTLITLPKSLRVDRRFVFYTAKIGMIASRVETEGFMANTDGPILVRQGLDIGISSVPHLTRLHLSGKVVRLVQVNLKAADINLKSSPSVELSYQPIVGISGGPVTANGKVIAMNSFADPGTFKHTWALQLKSSSNGLALP